MWDWLIVGFGHQARKRAGGGFFGTARPLC
jgi:hypothetical protein